MLRPLPDDPPDPPARASSDAVPHDGRPGDDADGWVPSPCTGDCILQAGHICRGCGRALDEIAHWTSLDEAQRRAALRAAHARQVAAR